MAVQKLSQIALAGSSPALTDTVIGVGGGTTDFQYTLTQIKTAVGGAPGGTPGQIQYNNAGSFGGFTASGDATINTSTGVVSVTLNVGTTAVSGGSAGNLLYTDGSLVQATGGVTWAGTGQIAIALGTITTDLKPLNVTGTLNAAGTTFNGPVLFANITNTASAAASSLINIQSSGVPQMIFQLGAAGVAPVLSIGNAAAGTGVLRIYNTVDTLNNPTNFERFTINWTTTGANTAVIGTEKGGTGSSRGLLITTPGQTVDIGLAGTGASFGVRSTGALINGSSVISFQSSNNTFGNATTAGDVGIGRPATHVLGINDGQGANANGWLQWAGEKRVSSDVPNSTATLATATGLSVSLQAGRTYGFDVYLSFTDAAAGGIQAAMIATGGLTATAIEYDGWIIDSAANGIKGNAQSAALAGVVASATTTGTAGVVEIKGTITVNVAGTLNVQFAQNTSNATATTVKAGSRMIVYDMP